jgi:hypothetical protein
MRQSIKPIYWIVLAALVVGAGACTAGPTEPSRQTRPDAARLNSSAAGSAGSTEQQSATSGVFIGGGMAAPADTTSRGVFIGGGM